VTQTTSASTVLVNVNAIRVIPSNEDWYITGMNLICSTNSSVASAHKVFLKTEGGSSALTPRANGGGTTNAATVLSMTSGVADASTAWSTYATATVSGSELEGTWCPAGSTLRLVSSGATAAAGMQFNVMGFTKRI